MAGEMIKNASKAMAENEKEISGLVQVLKSNLEFINNNINVIVKKHRGEFKAIITNYNEMCVNIAVCSANMKKNIREMAICIRDENGDEMKTVLKNLDKNVDVLSDIKKEKVMKFLTRVNNFKGEVEYEKTNNMTVVAGIIAGSLVTIGLAVTGITAGICCELGAALVVIAGSVLGAATIGAITTKLIISLTVKKLDEGRMIKVLEKVDKNTQKIHIAIQKIENTKIKFDSQQKTDTVEFIHVFTNCIDNLELIISMGI